MLSVKAVIQNGPSLFDELGCNSRYDEIGCNSCLILAVTKMSSFQRPKIVVHFGQCQTKNSELRDEGWNLELRDGEGWNFRTED